MKYGFQFYLGEDYSPGRIRSIEAQAAEELALRILAELRPNEVAQVVSLERYEQGELDPECRRGNPVPRCGRQVFLFLETKPIQFSRRKNFTGFNQGPRVRLPDLVRHFQRWGESEQFPEPPPPPPRKSLWQRFGEWCERPLEYDGPRGEGACGVCDQEANSNRRSKT